MPVRAIGLPAASEKVPGRRGVRIADLPADLVSRLSTGEAETRTWTEWMGVDMARLAYAVASELPLGPLQEALAMVAPTLPGHSILKRLSKVGAIVSLAVSSLEDASFIHLATHRSDAVRQWAVYAVNDPARLMALNERLLGTLPFAADPHMSVRECAWMAYRPFLLSRIEEGLALLLSVVQSDDFRLRRFAIEVSRPRSVWGKHSEVLKHQPELGRAVLEQVRCEGNRYVQLAVGNWINDASKTRPDWARALCAQWAQDGRKTTDSIVKRAMRTLRAIEAFDRHTAQASFSQAATNSYRGG